MVCFAVVWLLWAAGWVCCCCWLGCGGLVVCVLGGLWVWIVGIVLGLLVVLILVILFIVELV